MDWQFMTRKGVWELWKTPGRYLVCYHYKGIYKFFPDYQSAKNSLDKNSQKDYN